MGLGGYYIFVSDYQTCGCHFQSQWSIIKIIGIQVYKEGLEKPFVKLRRAYFVKLVFSFVEKGIKMKITVSRPSFAGLA